jgi:hypothetical protein
MHNYLKLLSVDIFASYSELTKLSFVFELPTLTFMQLGEFL